MREFAQSVFLTPTDTTMGFVSQSATRIDTLKHRPSGKYYILALPTLDSLKTTARVPQKYKNHLRRGVKTTFILPNTHSYRIVKGTIHTHLLEQIGWVYTSSANLSGAGYDEKFAKNKADIIVASPILTTQNAPSKILKINNRQVRRIR